MQRDELSAPERAYQEALDLLYSTINFEEKPADRYQANKLDTSRTSRLLAILDNPHHDYPAIHVAGTKGKGSVAAMSANILRIAGFRVGLFTSPHLRDVRERIRIISPEEPNGWISKADFVALMEKVAPQLEIMPDLTWFEIMTAIAFRFFSDQGVDIAVVEVGLGGRLDTTNVLSPLVSVITSLSLDHTYLLGNTLAQIAFEKGGIIKPGVPLVSAPQAEEALRVLQSIAVDRGSQMILIGREWQYQGSSRHLRVTHSPAGSFVPEGTNFELALAGDHQLENAVVALAALDSIKEQISPLKLDAARQGLAQVQWDGRLQTVCCAESLPTFLVDSAHNEASAAKLATALTKDYTYEHLWLIFGAPEDKQISQMMALLFPLAKGIIVAAADHPRATHPSRLVEMARLQGFTAVPASSPKEALQKTFSLAAAGDLICACGSIIFIGDLLNQWDRLKSELTAN